MGPLTQDVLWATLAPSLFGAFLVGARCFGMILALPGLSSGGFPAPQRMLFLLLLTVFCYSAIQMPLVAPPKQVPTLIAMMTREFLTGAALGFVVNMLLMVADVAGSVTAMAMSLSMAGMVDPNTGDQSTAVANLLTLGAMMAFVALDGHHEAVKGLIYNFKLFPVGTPSAAGFDVKGIANMATALFGTGLRLAAPIVVVTSLINVGLGLMARAAPQVNIFAVGFSILLVAGTLLLDATVLGLEREMSVRVPTLADEMNRGLIDLNEVDYAGALSALGTDVGGAR